MRNYSFCVLKKNNTLPILEFEKKDAQNYVRIKFIRNVKNNVKEYFFVKGVYDKYGITEYYENFLWEYEDKIILFAGNQYNVIDFCFTMKTFFKTKLRIQKISLNNIYKNDHLKIQKIFVQSKYNNFLREINKNEKILPDKYFKAEIIITLNQYSTFIEIFREIIFRLAYRITEVEFINIIEELI